MTVRSSQPQTTTAVLDAEEDAALVTCPMCHTSSSVTRSAIDAGGEWKCVRCGQHWDATRLSAVAAYAAWVVERAASIVFCIPFVILAVGIPIALGGRLVLWVLGRL